MATSDEHQTLDNLNVPTQELSADFTKASNEPEICERPSCKKVLPPGVKREYINGNTGGGRFICHECAIHYRSKGTTRRIDSTARIPVLLPPAEVDETESIRKENARAQRGEPVQREVRLGTLPGGPMPQYVQDTAGQIFAIPTVPPVRSGYISSATQPMVVRSSSAHSAYPTSSYLPSSVHVGIPGLTSTPALAPPASIRSNTLNSQGFGYTSSHKSYNSHRAQMAGRAYASDIELNGLVEVWLAELPEGRKQWKPIGGMEVFPVPIGIGVQALKSIAFENMFPVWTKWSEGFPLVIQQVTMRKKNWVRFEPVNGQDTNAIKAEFFAPPKKIGAPSTFKKDHKVTVLLHVPTEIVGDADFHRMTRQEEAKETGDARLNPRPTTPTKTDARIHTYEPTTPPQKSHKKARVEDIPAYQSPDRKRLAAALQAERLPVGKNIVAILRESSIPVRVFYAKNIHLNDLLLLASTSTSWRDYCTEGPLTTLFVDLSPKKAVKGEFKMTSLGQSNPPVFDSPEVAVKQLFFTKPAFKSKPSEPPEGDGNNSDQVNRKTTMTLHYYPCDPEKQHPALMMELKLIQWGQALLNLVYSYIRSKNPQEDINNFIEIPKFRFVRAAIAIEQIPCSSSSSRPRVFLLEEDLSSLNDGDFRKYMSNMPHIFMIFNDAQIAASADFLRFTQHVMYWKTKGLAYVSDYQGTDSTLTDCQLMTNRELGRIFADGNVPEGFDGLVTHHDCNNRFCQFFKPPKMNELAQEFHHNVTESTR